MLSKLLQVYRRTNIYSDVLSIGVNWGFLQAIERLQVNQTVNEICISALETVLRKLRAVGEKYAVHAMLMVDAKLLALYSRYVYLKTNPNKVG